MTAARAAIADARAQTGLPCDDLVRFGPDALYAAIAPQIGKTPVLHGWLNAAAAPRGAALAALLLAAPAARASRRAGDRRLARLDATRTVCGSASTEEPDSLNKLFANSDASDQVANLISAPIFRYDDTRRVRARDGADGADARERRDQPRRQDDRAALAPRACSGPTARRSTRATCASPGKP